ncbi:MAG TPA: LPXTG cell wall anchor domain-containing protein [Anaerolineae bacterium]|nr:LPXTG cell wall anchor domain-containing protein [Anaerolineae bacterium]
MQGKRWFRLAAPLALTWLGLAMLLWIQMPAPSHAQSGGIVVDKRLGRTSNVVYVGEYLTFTIRIRNDSAFTVTVLPLTDQYNTGVLAYVDASVAPDSVDTGAGRIDWADLTNAFGDLPPGQEIVLVVGFIAEHPAPAVVNYAAAHDAINSNGEVVGGEDESDANESVGGSAPVTKTMTAQAGQLVTFTIEVHNNGYTTMTQVMLQDVYNPAKLQFFYAVPPPDHSDPPVGLLAWDDLTLYTGDIPAHGIVIVTTVFTVVGDITSGVVNSATVVAAGDWYGNDVTSGAGEVPITVIERPRQSTPQPQATPTPYVTAETTPFPTATPFLALLPETGEGDGAGLLLWLALAVLTLAAGIGLFARRKPA